MRRQSDELTERWVAWYLDGRSTPGDLELAAEA